MLSDKIMAVLCVALCLERHFVGWTSRFDVWKLDKHGGPTITVELDKQGGPTITVELDKQGGPTIRAELDKQGGPTITAGLDKQGGPAVYKLP